MSRLGRHASRRLRGDRGAVAALVAVVLSGNLLLASGALAVDVGLIYAERSELQSGADAAAAAVAAECVGNNDWCDRGDMHDLADDYADDNAIDGAADVSVCGRVPESGSNRLAGCTGVPSGLGSCGPAPNHAYVEVRTTTLRSGGQTALPPIFAGVVSGYTGAQVRACSRVAWGPVQRIELFPQLAISICDYIDVTRTGTEFQARPIGSTHRVSSPSREVGLRQQKPTGTGCPVNGNIPRGFMWLDDMINGEGDCQAITSVGTTHQVRIDNGTQRFCAGPLTGALNKPVAVAIYDGVRNRNNSSASADIAGIAVFVVTGWFVPSPRHPNDPSSSRSSTFSGRNLCTGGTAVCVYGYFTTQVFQSYRTVGAVGADHFGAVYIKTIG